MLRDKFNRLHDYLRISLTDKCNLSCSYCKPADWKNRLTCAEQMSASEIERIAAIFVRSGVNKIRLTGGEPLIRKDAADIIERISKYPVELAITTNGVFVDDFIDLFKKTGLRSINVSLDSLKRDKYHLITKQDLFDKVVRNINLLMENNFHVKVNVVVMKNFNDNEILDFVKWTKDFPLHVRFIEFMPFEGNSWQREKVMSHAEILDIVSSQYKVNSLRNELSDTARKYAVEGHAGSFAVISTITEPFCSGCNRLRLGSDGRMFNCLFAPTGTDLLTPLRAGQDIEPLIRQCVEGKFFMLGGRNEGWEKEDPATSSRAMISIGG